MNTYTPSSDRIVHYTYADFTGRLIPRPVHIVQYDSSLPILAVTLYNDGQPYSISETTEANIRWHKTDGNTVYNPALGCDAERGVIYFEITKQMTGAPGTTEPVVELFGSATDVACSGSFPVIIDKNPVSDKDFQSSSEFRALIDYVIQAEEAAVNAEESEQAALEAEARTNAKAEEAEENAEIAEEAANTAQVEVTKAQTAVTEAKAEVTKAAAEVAKATAEVTKATAEVTKAQTAATNAATSAANAAQSETKIKQYNNDAEAWAVGTKDGVAVLSTDPQYNNHAKYWAMQAKGATKGYEPDNATIGLDSNGKLCVLNEDINIDFTAWT